MARTQSARPTRNSVVTHPRFAARRDVPRAPKAAEAARRGAQDMMNRTLYALTLVTFLATPIMLLTGTFGMNFSDMLELVQPRPLLSVHACSLAADCPCAWVGATALVLTPHGVLAEQSGPSHGPSRGLSHDLSANRSGQVTTAPLCIGGMPGF